jgi:cysteine desulfurase
VIYLDNNSTTQPTAAAVEAMLPYLRDRYFNPSAATAAHTGADQARTDAAAAMAQLLHAEEPDCFTFTSGATESNNWVMAAVRGGAVVISAVEHPSVTEPAQAIHGQNLRLIPVKPSAVLDLDALRRGLASDTVLVSIMAANNETGVLQPIPEAAAIVRDVSPRAILHVDATQWVGKLPVDLQADWAEVDALSFSAHKFHGPKGVGGLYLRPGTDLPPLLRGGGQESGRRAGTTNTPALAGLAAAAQEAATNPAESVRHWRDSFEADLRRRFPEVIIHGAGAPRLPNTSCFSLRNVIGDTLAARLAARGIIVGTGSACSSAAMHPPRTLLAMGVDYDIARAALRVSYSPGNLSTDGLTLLEVLTELYSE